MNIFRLAAVACVTAAAVLAAREGRPQTTQAPKHAAFERLKTLEGDWVGPAVWDQDGKKGSVEFELSYRITSGGKVVLETMLPGTPGEMVTTYYVEGADLVLVHYCTAGNQPRMKREPSDDLDDFAFRCTGGTNMTEADSHMHSARLTIVDADHIKGAWSSIRDGTIQWIAEATLQRRK